jgi:tRNA threonylcarbamoyladenosine modification (KEOPS) complex  Pcc1 subunit
MKCIAILKVYGDINKIYESFQTEINERDRSKLNIKKEKDHVLFEVNAEDPVALRATLNMITKLLTIYEKIDRLE